MSDYPEFSVFQFFPDETYECVATYVGAEEAVKTAKSYTTRPATQIGIIRKVMVTDGDDFCVFEWRYGEGVVFPPRGEDGWFTAEDLREPEKEKPA